MPWSLLFAVLTLTPSDSRPADDRPWRYDVTAGPGAKELAVEFGMPAGTAARLTVDEDGVAYVHEVGLVVDGGVAPIPESDGAWNAHCGDAGTCHVRYRFALKQAAEELDEQDTAIAYGDVYEAPPATWILHPTNLGMDAGLSIHMAVPKGIRFVSGLLPNRPDGGTYELDAEDLTLAPYSAFGPLRVVDERVGGSTLEIAFMDKQGPQNLIRERIHKAAEMISSYFGGFPVPHALILVSSSSGHRVHGKALGTGGASIHLTVGADVTPEDLSKDWVLVHELVHLAFPSQTGDHTWAEEGMATYVEPLVRIRAGEINAEKFWKDLVQGLPKGLPAPGDRGLDNTQTWGRTYWGGALFWFLADLDIRERSHGKVSLRDAYRGILRAGGNMTEGWPLRRALKAGDAAIGFNSLERLYDRHREKAVQTDLEAIFRRLGVSLDGTKFTFDDGAPLAHVRKAITQ